MKNALVVFAIFLIGLGIGVIYRTHVGSFEFHEAASHLTRRVLDPHPDVRPVPASHDNRTCHCGLYWNTCPCSADGRYPNQDYSLYSQFGDVPQLSGRPEGGFRAYLNEATGYDRLAPTGQPVEQRIRYQRSEGYRGGQLDEFFLHYDVPSVSVRGLYARHPGGANDLMLFSLGSWATPEHLLGMREDNSYHRKIAQYYFDQGMDVAVFNHGSNGSVETLLNLELSLHGVQVLGLWARSMCDFAELQRDQRNYDRVILYGLSRGGRVIEYTAALCSGYDLAFVGDNFSSSNWVNYYWDSQRTSDYGKYGAWFGHLQPVIGRFDVSAFMDAYVGTVIYVRSEEEVADDIERLRQYFEIHQGFFGPPSIGIVFKSDIGHVPELELLDLMLANDWAPLRGIRLEWSD